MAQDIYIRFKGDTTGLTAAVDRVNRSLNNLDRNSQAAQRSLSRIEQSGNRVAVSLRSVVGIMAALGGAAATKGIVNSYLEFERYRSVLTTFLGSAELANRELDRLQTLANQLPQDLSDVTQAFTIFTRMGLDTSTKSLTAFSNIATANAKSLTQFAEAVADAMTGEFERLKEFGIKVSKENDQFVARIGNQQVALANTSEDLVKQLQRLGEEGGRFGNAAIDNAGTLNQAFSNLRGAVFSASVAFMEGLSPALKTVIGDITNFVNENQGLITSLGEGLGSAIQFVSDNFNRFQSYLAAGVIVWGGYRAALIAATIATAGFNGMLALTKAALIRTGIGAIIVVLGELIYKLDQAAEELGGWSGLWTRFKEYGYAALQGIYNEFKILSARFELAGKLIEVTWQKVIAYLSQKWADFIGIIGPGFNRLAEVLNLGEVFDVVGLQAYASMLDHAVSNSSYKIEELRGNIKNMEETAWTAWNSVGQKTEEATDITAFYDDAILRAARGLGVVKEAATEAVVPVSKLSDEAEKLLAAFRQLPTDADNVRNAISTFERLNPLEGMEREYQSTLNGLKILRNRDLISEAEYFDAKAKLHEEHARSVRETQTQLMQDQIRASGITNQAVLDSLNSSVQNYQMIQQGGIQAAMGMTSELGNIFSQLGTYNKRAFEAAKAFNIANAIMNTYLGATKALAMFPPPFNFIAAAGVVAAGLAQVAAIRSQQFSGRALGGPVMGNQTYMVGENGPELFTPATSGRITRNDQLDFGGTPVEITFNINAIDAQGVDQLLVARKSVIQQVISDAMLEAGQRSRY